MFVELSALLSKPTDKIDLSITRGNGNVLTVMLVSKGMEFALPPLLLTATPEELDEEFAGVLSSYSEKHISIQDQLNANLTIMNATKEQHLKSVHAGKKTVKPTSDESHEDEDDEDSVGQPSSSSGNAQTEPEAEPEFNLFT